MSSHPWLNSYSLWLWSMSVNAFGPVEWCMLLCSQCSGFYLGILSYCLVSETHSGTVHPYVKSTLIARFMGPTWGPSGAGRTQVDPMLAPWTLPSGYGWLIFKWVRKRRFHDSSPVMGARVKYPVYCQQKDDISHYMYIIKAICIS